MTTNEHVVGGTEWGGALAQPPGRELIDLPDESPSGSASSSMAPSAVVGRAAANDADVATPAATVRTISASEVLRMLERIREGLLQDRRFQRLGELVEG